MAHRDLDLRTQDWHYFTPRTNRDWRIFKIIHLKHLQHCLRNPSYLATALASFLAPSSDVGELELPSSHFGSLQL